MIINIKMSKEEVSEIIIPIVEYLEKALDYFFRTIDIRFLVIPHLSYIKLDRILTIIQEI